MSEQSNMAVVQAAYDAFRRGDIPALLERLAPDITWEAPGPKTIPWAGSYRGRDQIPRFFMAIAEHCEMQAWVATKIIAVGDDVAAFGTSCARMKSSGVVYEGHWAHAMTVVNGKITQYRQYDDTAGVAEALTRT